MKKIYKYELMLKSEQVVMLPFGFEILCAQIQKIPIFIWAIIDPLQKPVPVAIDIFGTGHEMDNKPRKYIGTVQDGLSVWHIFYCTPE